MCSKIISKLSIKLTTERSGSLSSGITQGAPQFVTAEEKAGMHICVYIRMYECMYNMYIAKGHKALPSS